MLAAGRQQRPDPEREPGDERDALGEISPRDGPSCGPVWGAPGAPGGTGACGAAWSGCGWRCGCGCEAAPG
ncbi:hypothetical protein, partial [Actinomadura sp. CNU-125]|uniref:hypothetical protein n=1 Tax=Actinomadura sp. CNU-125 TaxID=1904961 RepID=UPI0021CC6795